MIRKTTIQAELEVDTKEISARVILPDIEIKLNELLPIITFDHLDGYTTLKEEDPGMTLVVRLFLAPK